MLYSPAAHARVRGSRQSLKSRPQPPARPPGQLPRPPQATAKQESQRERPSLKETDDNGRCASCDKQEPPPAGHLLARKEPAPSAALTGPVTGPKPSVPEQCPSGAKPQDFSPFNSTVVKEE